MPSAPAARVQALASGLSVSFRMKFRAGLGFSRVGLARGVQIKDVHWLGVRSKTKVTEKVRSGCLHQLPTRICASIQPRTRYAPTFQVMSAGKRLLGVGCFCIGTDQVDLQAVRKARAETHVYIHIYIHV